MRFELIDASNRPRCTPPDSHTVYRILWSQGASRLLPYPAAFELISRFDAARQICSRLSTVVRSQDLLAASQLDTFGQRHRMGTCWS